MAMQGGIMTRVYKPGSIIYFENDKSEYIYILKSGRVLLTYNKIDTGEEMKEDVRQGEFFGVKSALGKYPREETAQTIGETAVLVLGLAAFEELVLKNVSIVHKMLRVFSNQLRRIGKTVRTVLGESDSVKPDLELFRIGEHYYKSGDYAKASYAFKKYMEYYPDSDKAQVAMDRIRTVGVGGPGGLVAPVSGGDDVDFTFDGGDDQSFGGFDDDNFMPELSGDGEVGGDSPIVSSEFSSEMNDFLSDDFDDFDDFGDFSFGGDETNEEPEPGLPRAQSYLEAENYEGALELFEELVEKGQDLPEAEYGTGLCLFHLKKYKESMQHLGKVAKEYQDSEKFKNSIFYIGRIFEVAGQKNKAIGYYNKVLKMSPEDHINSEALDRIKGLQGG